ncbi:MAG: hypothetical protein ACSLFP_12880 [Acidimicrobiales bacterium]
MRHATIDQSADAAPTGRLAPPMPLPGERMAPWLVGAALVAVVNLVVALSGHSAFSIEQAVLLVALSATLAAGGLVASRSDRALAARDREHRARPAFDELATEVGATDAASYVAGMREWTRAMLELIEHARGEVDPTSPQADQLTAAADDTQALCDLLDVSAQGPLGINDTAMLHSVCSLWEANQPHLEDLAAAADPAWHRRWRARSVVASRLRHGPDTDHSLLLPYRS